MILGLLVAGGRPKWLPGSTKAIEKLHRTTSLSVIGLTAVHIALMILRRIRNPEYTVARSFWENLVPGAWSSSSSGQWGIGVGLVSFYLAIVLGLSYYFRHRLGIRAWRFAHRFSILVYVLATWHTFVYGSDTWYTGYQRTAFWIIQLPIAYMVLARLLAPLRRSERLPLKPAALLSKLNVMTVLRLGVRLIAATSIVVLAGILILDRTGGHQHPDEYPSAEDTEHEMEHDTD